MGITLPTHFHIELHKDKECSHWKNYRYVGPMPRAVPTEAQCERSKSTPHDDEIRSDQRTSRHMYQQKNNNKCSTSECTEREGSLCTKINYSVRYKEDYTHVHKCWYNLSKPTPSSNTPPSAIWLKKQLAQFNEAIGIPWKTKPWTWTS